MSNWRKIAKRSTVLLCVLFSVFAAAVLARSQPRLPGPAARENNRSMDEYDRTLNRMKNDAKAATERRRNLFPQINEDFQRIQVIHNEMVRMLQQKAIQSGLVKRGDLVAITAGLPLHQAGTTNMITVKVIE